MYVTEDTRLVYVHVTKSLDSSCHWRSLVVVREGGWKTVAALEAGGLSILHTYTLTQTHTQAACGKL